MGLDTVPEETSVSLNSMGLDPVPQEETIAWVPLTPAKFAPGVSNHDIAAGENTQLPQIPRNMDDSDKTACKQNMNILKNEDLKKRKTQYGGLNQNPRKRQKMKRHRPKVYDESKPKKAAKTSTPKAKTSTPKPQVSVRVIPTPSPHEKKRCARKSSLKASVDHPKDMDSSKKMPQRLESINGSFGNPKEACRKKLEFDLNVAPESDYGQMQDILQVSLNSSDLHGEALYSNSESGYETSQNILNDIWEGQKRDSFQMNGSNEMFMQGGNMNLQLGEESIMEEQNCISMKLEPQDFHFRAGTRQIVHKYCRRPKNFKNLKLKGDHDTNLEAHNSKVHDDITDKLELTPSWRSRCSFILRVYERKKTLRCPKISSKKSFPVFPNACKKTRMQRCRAAALYKFHIVAVTNKCQILRVFERKKTLRCPKISSKKSFPVFPNACKKTRMQRCRAAALDKFHIMAVTNKCQNVGKVKAKTDKSFHNARKVGQTSRKHLSKNVTENVTQEVDSALDRSSVGSYRECDNSRPTLGDPSTKKNLIMSTGDDNAYIESLISFTIQKLKSLRIDDEKEYKQIVMRSKKANGAIVPFSGKFDPSEKPKHQPKVDLDQETTKMWNLLMENSVGEDPEELDDDKVKYWEQQQKIMRGKMELFLARMHLILGDRRFQLWEASVLDSIVGVYLTQNVSDYLSSSAFMSMVATYPAAPVSNESDSDENNVTSPKPVSLKGSLGNDFAIHEVKSINGSDGNNVTSREPASLKDSLDNDCTVHESVESTSGNENFSHSESTPRKKKGKANDMQNVNWDDLRRTYSQRNPGCRPGDSVNWEAVRQAPVEEVANVIKIRGMHNIIAKKIKDFLNRVVRDHGSLDLEWLRDVPPDKAKAYLLSIYGIGLKSVECVRLLALHHHAFPVDTNIGRILVRLGWVPLQPLPEDLQLHLLNTYPMLDTVQKYIWPRLCNVEKLTLYEFHYQLITFGKIFCTKRQPNCNACPMRGECKHFASAFASAKPRLRGSEVENMAAEPPLPSELVHRNPSLLSHSCSDARAVGYEPSNCEPIVEIPASPEPVPAQTLEMDIEDFCCESDDEIPVFKLNDEDFVENVVDLMGEPNFLCEEEDMLRAVVPLSPEAACIPMPKLKQNIRLRTVHQVYELPDSHPLLQKLHLQKRVPDDPCPYLLAIWITEDIDDSSQQLKESTPRSECTTQSQNEHIVKGTILIPCRTANRATFPLNGTYFQVNEVFSDHLSSKNPIDVPRKWIWNLPRRTLFCGTSISSICKGLSLEEIHHAFWNGFICVRGYEKETRAPRPLATRFHHICRTKTNDDE